MGKRSSQQYQNSEQQKLAFTRKRAPKPSPERDPHNFRLRSGRYRTKERSPDGDALVTGYWWVVAHVLRSLILNAGGRLVISYPELVEVLRKRGHDISRRTVIEAMAHWTRTRRFDVVKVSGAPNSYQLGPVQIVPVAAEPVEKASLAVELDLDVVKWLGGDGAKLNALLRGLMQRDRRHSRHQCRPSAPIRFSGNVCIPEDQEYSRTTSNEDVVSPSEAGEVVRAAGQIAWKAERRGVRMPLRWFVWLVKTFAPAYGGPDALEWRCRAFLDNTAFARERVANGAGWLICALRERWETDDEQRGRMHSARAANVTAPPAPPSGEEENRDEEIARWEQLLRAVPEHPQASEWRRERDRLLRERECHPGPGGPEQGG